MLIRINKMTDSTVTINTTVEHTITAKCICDHLPGHNLKKHWSFQLQKKIRMFALSFCSRQHKVKKRIAVLVNQIVLPTKFFPVNYLKQKEL